MADHLFRNGAACVFCGATPEKVQDRMAPPFCVERQDEEFHEEWRDHAERNSSTGY